MGLTRSRVHSTLDAMTRTILTSKQARARFSEMVASARKGGVTIVTAVGGDPLCDVVPHLEKRPEELRVFHNPDGRVTLTAIDGTFFADLEVSGFRPKGDK